MDDRPDWLPDGQEPEGHRISAARRVTSLLLVGIGLLFFVPGVYASILDWHRNGAQAFWEFFPCCSIVAAPFFIGAWRLRAGPLTQRQRRLGSHLATAILTALLIVDLIIVALLVSEWLRKTS